LQHLWEIDLEEVARDLVHVLRLAWREGGWDMAIELDRDDPARTLRQWDGQCTAAGTDLDEGFVLRGRDGCNQSCNPGGLEEVLTESFARLGK
jgi:hypothetical protein